jgi:hypothetical protein
MEHCDVKRILRAAALLDAAFRERRCAIYCNLARIRTMWFEGENNVRTHNPDAIFGETADLWNSVQKAGLSENGRGSPVPNK